MADVAFPMSPIDTTSKNRFFVLHRMDFRKVLWLQLCLQMGQAPWPLGHVVIPLAQWVSAYDLLGGIRSPLWQKRMGWDEGRGLNDWPMTPCKADSLKVKKDILIYVNTHNYLAEKNQNGKLTTCYIAGTLSQIGKQQPWNRLVENKSV